MSLVPGRAAIAPPAPGSRRPLSTPVAAVAGLMLLILLLAGCGGEPAPAAPSVTLRVVIPDTNIREPDAACAGAFGFRFAHPQAPFAVHDAAGREVAAGVLPEGRAEQAFTVDFGVDRQPTVCVMLVDVAGVATLDGHSLVIDGRRPVPITPNPNLAGAPEVVLR